MNTRHGLTLGLALLIALAGCSSGAATTTPGSSAPSTALPSSPAAAKSSKPSPAPTIQDVMKVEEFAPLEPGTYFIDPDLDPATPLHVTYEVPFEGWNQWIGAIKGLDDGTQVGVAITTVTNLVRDACLDHSYADPPVGPSVDDLASGLAGLTPFRATRPRDVTIYGYSGKHLELTVPSLPHGFSDCVDGNLNSYVAAIDAAGGEGASWHGYTGPGYREELWILDVEGTRLMIAAERSPSSSPADLAEVQAILDSIRIEPSSPFTQRFDSALNGFSIGYPSGWHARTATGPWGGRIAFDAPDVDVIFDPKLRDDLYIAVVSEPLGSTSPQDWVRDHYDRPSMGVCYSGGAGGIGNGFQGNPAWFQECYDPRTDRRDGHIAVFATPTRGYVIYVHVADWRHLGATYDGDWFWSIPDESGLLSTVELRPGDAIGTVNPSESP